MPTLTPANAMPDPLGKAPALAGAVTTFWVLSVDFFRLAGFPAIRVDELPVIQIFGRQVAGCVSVSFRLPALCSMWEPHRREARKRRAT